MFLSNGTIGKIDLTFQAIRSYIFTTVGIVSTEAKQRAATGLVDQIGCIWCWHYDKLNGGKEFQWKALYNCHETFVVVPNDDYNRTKERSDDWFRQHATIGDLSLKLSQALAECKVPNKDQDPVGRAADIKARDDLIDAMTVGAHSKAYTDEMAEVKRDNAVLRSGVASDNDRIDSMTAHIGFLRHNIDVVCNENSNITSEIYKSRGRIEQLRDDNNRLNADLKRKIYEIQSAGHEHNKQTMEISALRLEIDRLNARIADMTNGNDPAYACPVEMVPEENAPIGYNPISLSELQLRNHGMYDYPYDEVSTLEALLALAACTCGKERGGRCVQAEAGYLIKEARKRACNSCDDS